MTDDIGPRAGAGRPRRRHQEGLPLARRVGSWVVWWVLLMSLWIWLDDSLALAELLAGAGAAALGASAVEAAQYQAATHLRLRIEWVAAALRLPATLVRDTGIVTVALWHRLVHGREPASGAAGGIFFGLGDPPPEDPHMAAAADEETSETDAAKNRTPWSMIVPPALLLGLALAVGLVPQVGSVVQGAAVRFEDQAAYNALVLSGHTLSHLVAPAATEDSGITVADVATGVGSAVGALLLALVGLYRRRIRVLHDLPSPTGLADHLRALQSGVVNDYVVWLVFGLACLGGALAFSIR